MSAWSPERSGKFWTYCHPCKEYTYTIEDTREHHMSVHGRTREDVNNTWPDGKVA